jgi:hypothetical protein
MKDINLFIKCSQSSLHDDKLRRLIKDYLIKIEGAKGISFKEGLTWHEITELDSFSRKYKSPQTVTEIRNELRVLYATYARTKDIGILTDIKSLILALNKSMLKQLKRLFRTNQSPKRQSRRNYSIDQRKKIRSLTLFCTTYFTNVNGCEENSYAAFSKGERMLFLNHQKRCVCTTRKKILNRLENI